MSVSKRHDNEWGPVLGVAGVVVFSVLLLLTDLVDFDRWLTLAETIVLFATLAFVWKYTRETTELRRVSQERLEIEQDRVTRQLDLHFQRKMGRTPSDQKTSYKLLNIGGRARDISVESAEVNARLVDRHKEWNKGQVGELEVVFDGERPKGFTVNFRYTNEDDLRRERMFTIRGSGIWDGPASDAD